MLLSYLQLVAEQRIVVHAAAVDALAPGGTLFLVAHHADNLEHGVGGPQIAEVLYTEADLATDFASLEIVTLQRVLRPATTADGVPGEAIDVLVVARRSQS